MADRSKFEKMLELLVNEQKDEAEALFHEIVVEKSRDIYESLLEDEEVDESDDDLDEADEEVDESDDDLDEADDEEVDESDEELDEYFNLDEFEVEADPMMGGDPTDDMIGDMEPGADDDEMDMDMDMGDEEGDEGDMDDRVEDLEDALEDLKAEFEKMMSGSDDDMDMDDEGDDDMDMGGDDEEGDDDDEEEKESFYYEDDEEVDESDDEDVSEAKKMKKDDKMTKKSSTEEMREYVEKIGGDRYNTYGKMGDNGANSKSTVASKNDMGGSTKNILSGGTETPTEANKGQLKGNGVMKGTPKDMNTKNVNVPGGKAGKTAFKKSEPGHGAERKGKPETADKSAGSPLNGAPKRAK